MYVIHFQMFQHLCVCYHILGKIKMYTQKLARLDKIQNPPFVKLVL